MEDNQMNLTNNEEDAKELLDDITAGAMVQPVLYLQKAPNAEVISKVVANNRGTLLHTAPVVSSAVINNSIAKLTSDNNYTNTLGPSADKLYYNQEEIMVDQVTEYVIQNTLIAFCNMLDYTGKNFRSIIDYIPIKNYVATELNNYDDTLSIKGFISSYIYYRGKNSLYEQFVRMPKEEAFRPDGVFLYNSEIASQLEQLIFTKLCKACDKAITEVLLGTRVTPNLKYIVDNACKYFGITYKGLETKNEIYFRLNTTLVHMLDNLMSAVIVPMSDNLFKYNIFGSFYYAYGMIAQNYFDNRKENAQEDIKEDIDCDPLVVEF